MKIGYLSVQRNGLPNVLAEIVDHSSNGCSGPTGRVLEVWDESHLYHLLVTHSLAAVLAHELEVARGQSKSGDLQTNCHSNERVEIYVALNHI